MTLLYNPKCLRANLICLMVLESCHVTFLLLGDADFSVKLVDGAERSGTVIVTYKGRYGKLRIFAY